MRGDEATVWWAHLDDWGAEPFEDVLSPDERNRAAAFRFPRDRSRFVAARGLLRTLLGDYLGVDPKRIELAYDENGKPRLADGDTALRFNLSHSNGVLALALCEGREIGIDIEALRDDPFMEAIARRFLPPEAAMEIERQPRIERSREFFRAWVRQEAYAKAHGAGLELIGESPDSGSWSIADLDLLDGYAAAVAIESDAPARVSARPIA
jgi:4'-phosphopantetheinyl transferase